MSTLTDRYCPNCFRRLNEGVKDWLWCPDTYYCEFECNISKEDKTISELEMYEKKLERTKRQLDDLNDKYDREKMDLENFIASLSSKIADSSPAGISEAKPKPTANK